MAKTNGSRNFSDLLDDIQILARRPMSQVSSSFSSYYDKWDDSTNATEYYDIDDLNNVDNDGYYDEYDEPEDHDNEWIDMSGIPEGRLRSKNQSWRGKKGCSKGESRDVQKAGKGGRPENCKQVRLKLQSDRLNRGWKDSQLMERTQDVVVHSWPRWMISSRAPVVSNVESWGILRRTALRTRNQPQIPRLSSVVWFTTTPAMLIFETSFVLVTAVTILILVFLETIVLVFLETIVLVFLETVLVLVTLETNPVLTMTLKTNPV